MTATSSITTVKADIVSHVPALRHLARRFYSATHDVDDLVHEPLLKALAYAEKFRSCSTTQ